MPMLPVCGVIFLDKPTGWTSRQAVNAVIRQFSEPGKKRVKAGHGGTLDPLASGMLPILLGYATRFAEMGLNAEKCYRVSFDLSFQTDTLDLEGELTDRFAEQISRLQLEQTLESFRGDILQTPPAYSAIRIDGKRAHELARSGAEVTMQPRSVSIQALELESFEFPQVTLFVRCSKGTYIRSLARDIGVALGLGGCVTSLRRLSTGGWPEAMMVSPEQLEADGERALMPLAQWLRDLNSITLSESDGKRFLQGQRLQIRATKTADQEQAVAVFADDLLLGTGMLKSGLRHMVLHPAKILPSAQQQLL